jgi:hypothetical protein
VDTGTGTALADLYDNDAVFFMKAQDSERVEVVFTRESGYVSHLRIIDGPNKGYEFNEPDTRNTTPSYFFMIVGAVIAIVGIFKWIVDHNADPALEG